MTSISTELRPQPQKTAGQRIQQALSRALSSQLHPKMLGALLLPFLVAFFAAATNLKSAGVGKLINPSSFIAKGA